MKGDDSKGTWEEEKTYRTSKNPIRDETNK
jgi:hypothetical protein